MNYYVGLRQGKREVFKTAGDTSPLVYNAVVGPFKTKRPATWAVGQVNNPHYRSVADAERISRGNL